MAGSGHIRVAPTGSDPFLRSVAVLSNICGYISAALIVISVGVTCHMIFVRSVLNQSTIWQTESVIYMMIAATLLGLPYVQRLRGHVNVDLLPMILPRPLRKLLNIVTLIAAIIVIGIIVVYGYDNWHIAWTRNWKSDTVWGVSLWIPYLSVPIGFGLYLLQLVADLYAVIRNIDPDFGLSDVSKVEEA